MKKEYQILGCLIFVCFGVLLLLGYLNDLRYQEMKVKCSPDPSIFECQVYISRQGAPIVLPAPVIVTR